MSNSSKKAKRTVASAMAFKTPEQLVQQLIGKGNRKSRVS
jgi:hypothetical protein